MQIPYEVSARPDTGLYNAKLGIWLFLASEVMLFGGLFSAYLFMRLGAEPGYWPKGLLNVPVGTMNTAILIGSSVTVVLAWASLKMRRWNQYVIYMSITIFCAFLFLGVKLGKEWPEKFGHFAITLKKDSMSKYEEYLGNEHRVQRKLDPRTEITGHLHEVIYEEDGQRLKAEVHSPGQAASFLEGEEKLEGRALEPRDVEELEAIGRAPANGNAQPAPDEKAASSAPVPAPAAATTPAARTAATPAPAAPQVRLPKLLAYVLALDPGNADPNNPDNDKPHFWTRDHTEKMGVVKAEDVEHGGASAFLPRHSTYLGTYFLITGLHGLHVLGGALVFCQMLFFGKKLYLRNPEHMANRVEVAGLFWHFVDLVWIFVFPIFYLL